MHEEMKDETYIRNRKVEDMVKYLIQNKGMIAKEAYKYVVKNRF